MPGYGRQTMAAGLAFWHACRDMSGVTCDQRSGSLLAANFNQIWCYALNAVHHGRRVDYFAMLHDDVGAEEFWLDTLIDELEEKELDVLGVVVPIKDTRGVTSIALDREGESWFPWCKLTMHDVYQLPETFTSDDVGRPLLLNTGCWVMKWNQDVCRQLHFEINDRIVFNESLGGYQSQTEPEDWNFSRQLHEIGHTPDSQGMRPLRIGATRKIRVEHCGEMNFTNTRAWGTDHFDTELMTRSPVPGAFPYDILGWLLPEEGAKLAELATGKRVLEIGSFCGLSTVCMARTAEHVTAIDYFDGRGTSVRGDCRPLFDESLRRHGVTDKVTACHPEAELPFDEYDLVFIDGAHDVGSVRADIKRALSVVASDGLVVFHDYSIGIDKGVDAAVDEFLESGATLVSQTKSLAVVKPPAAIPLEV